MSTVGLRWGPPGTCGSHRSISKRRHAGPILIPRCTLFDVNLAPGQRIRIRPDASLKLSQRNGQAVPISDMTGFVNHVEFADGSMWIPERSSIEGTRLKQLLNPSAEEQRLSDMYRRKGIDAVIDELRKY